MDVGVTIVVSKAIAEGLKSHPEHVQECIREAEASMNVVALGRKRVVAAMPRLVDVRDSSLGRDLVEIRFQAPTRAA